jgi:hypothetical protein
MISDVEHAELNVATSLLRGFLSQLNTDEGEEDEKEPDDPAGDLDDRHLGVQVTASG